MLSAMETRIIRSNLARDCEKQYPSQQAEYFRKLAAFFRSKAEPFPEAGAKRLPELIGNELPAGYPTAAQCQAPPSLLNLPSQTGGHKFPLP